MTVATKDDMSSKCHRIGVFDESTIICKEALSKMQNREKARTCICYLRGPKAQAEARVVLKEQAWRELLA